MTAAVLGDQVTGVVSTLEVRWILPGRLEAAVAEWLSRFPAGVESREDAYLLSPQLGGPSVKLRAGEALEVKVYRGSTGFLDTGQARGRIESWQKWSFPCGRAGTDGTGQAGWLPVRKHRRLSRFPPASADSQAPAQRPGCAVELTEIRLPGEDDWWSLGFEAAGPAAVLRSDLEFAARLIFAEPPPAGLRLDTDQSLSYAEWLASRVQA